MSSRVYLITVISKRDHLTDDIAVFKLRVKIEVDGWDSVQKALNFVFSDICSQQKYFEHQVRLTASRMTILVVLTSSHITIVNI